MGAKRPKFWVYGSQRPKIAIFSRFSKLTQHLNCRCADSAVRCIVLMHAVWSVIAMILSSSLSVCPSVCDEIYCGAQGRCIGLKVGCRCVPRGTSCSLLQTLLFSYNTCCHGQTDSNGKKLTGSESRM